MFVTLKLRNAMGIWIIGSLRTQVLLKGVYTVYTNSDIIYNGRYKIKRDLPKNAHHCLKSHVDELFLLVSI